MADRSNIGTKDMQLRASQSRGAFQIPKCLMYQIVERKIYNLERSNSEVHNKPGFRWVCASVHIQCNLSVLQHPNFALQLTQPGSDMHPNVVMQPGSFV